MNYLDVATTLENFIEDRSGPWDWDDYISAEIFDDPYLQEVQRRMAFLSTEFPPLSVGHYCSPEGIAVIRGYIDDLRSKANAIR